MKSFRAYWSEEVAEKTVGAPRLRVVSRVAPPRPRWRNLYLALVTIGMLGTLAHFMVGEPMLLEVVDVLFAAVLVGALAGWVHCNRVGLTRLDEPDAGTGRPHVRIVRSRGRAATEADADDGVVRPDPDDRVILPYDFR